MDYVLIGKAVNTFGIRGELKIDVYTDFVEQRFKKGSTVYIGEDHCPLTVNSYRWHQGFLLLSFVQHDDINLVEKYKNMMVYKAKEDIHKLKKGEYYFSDLKDLDVFVNKQKIGHVLYVEEGIRNNNLRILKDEDHKEYLVPFLPVFVENVDLEQKRIDIVFMEGLL